MNIRFVGIDGLGENEVHRLFSTLTDFDFISEVGIRKFHNSFGEGLDIYDVTIEIKPDRADHVSIHIFDNSVHFVDCRPWGLDKAIIYIDRSAYERLEII